MHLGVICGVCFTLFRLYLIVCVVLVFVSVMFVGIAQIAVEFCWFVGFVVGFYSLLFMSVFGSWCLRLWFRLFDCLF